MSLRWKRSASSSRAIVATTASSRAQPAKKGDETNMATGYGVASPFPLSENQGTSVYLGPFGRRFIDPQTGSEYLLCDAQEAFDAGEWCVINGSGQASQLTSTSKGRVGIVVAAASSSDLAIWVQVVGSY